MQCLVISSSQTVGREAEVEQRLTLRKVNLTAVLIMKHYADGEKHYGSDKQILGNTKFILTLSSFVRMFQLLIVYNHLHKLNCFVDQLTDDWSELEFQ